MAQLQYQIGDLIHNQYRVEDSRSGGMGCVYIVWDEATGKRFALKTIRADRQQDEMLQRFHREARVWVNLGHHPNLVEAHALLLSPDAQVESEEINPGTTVSPQRKRDILKLQQSDAPPLILLEYVDGPNVQELLKIVGSVSPRQSLLWMIQTAEGMQHVHHCRFPDGQVGTIHRDLKPANILLSRQNIPKITDFGLAKMFDQLSTTTNKTMGTIAYSSPEQLRDAKHVDVRSDIFSFGAMFYEVVTGKKAFFGDNIADVLQAIGHRDPDWSLLPESLRGVFRRCLEKSPQLRFENFEEVLIALRELTISPSSSEVTCDGCGFISVGIIDCPICGDEREPAEENVSAAGKPVNEGDSSSFCRHCGSQNQFDNSYCNHCGSRMQVADEAINQ